jgi:Zn-finger nucleic acid-binding protein
MSDAKISFRCPGCQELIGFPGEEAGTVQDCPECGGWVDVPELSRLTRMNGPFSEQNDPLVAENARQFEENARLQEMSGSSHIEWRKQLEQSARYQDHAEAVFERFAALMSRWEELTARLERVLMRSESAEK